MALISANLPGGNDAGTVGSNQPALILALELLDDLDHVMLGNAFCDADNQRNLSINSLNDGSRCPGGWNVNDGAVGLYGGLGLNAMIFIL